MLSQSEEAFSQPIQNQSQPQETKKRGARFWLIILGINISSFLALLEAVCAGFGFFLVHLKPLDHCLQRPPDHNQRSSWRQLHLGWCCL